MFSSTKAGHLAHIGMTALLGQVASHELVPPDPTQIENYGRLIIQALVAIATIWATVRKALQRPEEVMKVPAEARPIPKDSTGSNERNGNDGLE
jgi:H+/gluconate symporter-like permease